jgi:iron(III) transport system permease protein
MAFFFIAVLIPIVNLGVGLLRPGAFQMFGTAAFTSALVNSVVSSLLGTLFSLVLALVAALSLTRTRTKIREAWVIALTLPMLIPSIAHGMGLIYLLGSNGIVTNLLGASWSVYGLPGIVLGSVMYAFPPAFLMLYDTLRYEDCTVYDAADIMGIPKLSQFLTITLGYLKKPLISATFATFTLIITDYGVPIMIGGKYTTLSVLMYNEVIGRLNIDSGVAIGSVLILPAIVAFVVDLVSTGQANLGYGAHAKRIGSRPTLDRLSLAFRSVLLVFLLAPIFTFVIVAFVTKYPVNMAFTTGNIGRALVFGMREYWFNSLIIAVAVSLLGTLLAWLAAYVSARTPGRFGRVLHLICITTMAVPGVVLGLSYMLFFKGSPLYGTLGILVLVNLIHFFANPYLLAYNALNKLNANLESVGLTLGIPRFHMIKDILLPQTKETILEMISYFFVNCMVTISAVSFLSSVAHMPLALLISDFDTQMLIECAALVALVIFVTNVVAKLVLYVLKRFVLS